MADMRYGIIREKQVKGEALYRYDGLHCPACHWPTEIGEDTLRRYCTNKVCNAMILEET